MDSKSNKKFLPRQLRYSSSLLLSGAFIVMAAGGYYVLRNNAWQGTPGIVASAGFILVWLFLVYLCMRRGHWIPLLISTIYWLMASAIKLFITNADEIERQVTIAVVAVSNFASVPLQGLRGIHPDAIILAMALLAIASMIGLIVILDRNKPKT